MEPCVSQYLFRSDPQAVRRALAGALGGLAHLPLTPDQRHSLELVLAEVLNNVVEHAYAGDGAGVIELTISVTSDAVVCEVSDTGRPMPDGTPPPGQLPSASDDLPEDVPEGGFGWFLIRALTENLTYSRESNRNRLQFSMGFQTADLPG